MPTITAVQPSSCSTQPTTTQPQPNQQQPNQPHHQANHQPAPHPAPPTPDPHRWPWEGDRTADPRLCANAYRQTPWQVAQSSGQGPRLCALLSPSAALRRALMMTGANLEPTGVLSLQAIAGKALHTHLSRWLDGYEARRGGMGGRETGRRCGVGAEAAAALCSCSSSGVDGAINTTTVQLSCSCISSSSSSNGLACSSSIASEISAVSSSSSSSSAAAVSAALITERESEQEDGKQEQQQEQQQEEEEECGICLDAAPCLSLKPCHHLMCAGCVRGVLKAAAGAPFGCPFCRRTVGRLAELTLRRL